jgi:hypothetical protein
MARADNCLLWGRRAGAYNDHIISLRSDDRYSCDQGYP